MKNFIIPLVLVIIFFYIVINMLDFNNSNTPSNKFVSDTSTCLEEYKLAYNESINAMNNAYTTLENYDEGDNYNELVQAIRETALMVDDRELNYKISSKCYR